MRRDRAKLRAYRFLSSPRFPSFRLGAYVAQVPPAVLITALATSVQYLVFLSLAALIESALTDVVQTWAPVPRGVRRGIRPSRVRPAVRGVAGVAGCRRRRRRPLPA